MPNSVGDISLDLLFNTQPFKSALGQTDTLAKKAGKQLEGSFNGAGGAIGGLTSLAKGFGGAIIAGFAVDAVINFGKECLSLGSNLSEVQNVVDVTFGGMSTQVNDFAKNAASAYGLSETMAKKYMGTFGAMSKAFKFNTQEAYNMSAALTGLSGDVASFYNISQDEAYTKLKSVFTGETETLKDLGVVMTQAALDQYALANGYGKTTSKMTEQEKVALRFAFVQKQLALATGDYTRTQDGWANQTRQLNLQWQQFKATMGQGLINIFLPVVKGLNWILAKLQIVAEAFKGFTEFITGKASEDVQGGIGSMSEDMSDLMNGTIDLGDQVEDTAKKIKKSVMGFDELHLLDGEDDPLDDLFNGLDDAINAIGGGGNKFQWPTFDTMGAEKYWGALLEGAEDFKQKARDVFNDATAAAAEFAFELNSIPVFFGELGKAADRLKEKIRDAFKIPDGFKIPFPIPDPVPVPAMDLSKFFESVKEYQKPITAPVFQPALAPALQLWPLFIPSLSQYRQPILAPVFELPIAPALDFLTLFVPSVEWYQNPITAPVFEPVFAPAIDVLTLFAPTLEFAKMMLFGFTEQSKQGVLEWSLNLGGTLGLFGALVASVFATSWGSANASVQVNTGAMTQGSLGFITNLGLNFQTGLETVRGLVDGWGQNTRQQFGLTFMDLLTQGIVWGLGTQLQFQTTLEGAKNWVNGGTESIKQKFGETYGNIAMSTSAWSASTLAGFSSTMSSIPSFVSSGLGSARNAFNGFLSGTGNAVCSWGQSIASNISATFSNVVSAIQTATNRAWSHVNGLIDKAKAAIDRFLYGSSGSGRNFDPNSITDSTQGKTMIPGASPVMPSMPNFGFGLVPAFASGAYIRPNSPQLAMIGDNKTQGEFVAPEDKLKTAVLEAMKSFGGQNSSGSRNQTQRPDKLQLIVQLGDYTFVNTLIDLINNETRRQGEPLIR